MVAPSSHRSDNNYVPDLASWIKGRVQFLRISMLLWLDALLCALLGHHDVTALDDEFVSHGFPPLRLTQDDLSVPRAGDRRGTPGRVAGDMCSATPRVSSGIKRREHRPRSG